MSNRTIQSTVDFEPALHEALKSKAESLNSSVSELVNNAIRLLLLEDQEDLAAFEARADEPTLSHEELLNDLKAHGKL
ncbi:MAG: CopG family transcriptional regulator [Cyanobacteria bacterium P01_A01_bin.116]